MRIGKNASYYFAASSFILAGYSMIFNTNFICTYIWRGLYSLYI